MQQEKIYIGYKLIKNKNNKIYQEFLASGKSMQKEEDYQKFILSDIKWTLIEAVILVNGEEQSLCQALTSCDYSQNKDDIGFQRYLATDSIKSKAQNKLTYQKALKAINQNKLLAEQFYLREDGDKVDYLVKSRDFIKWCIDEGIGIAPRLMKYFNYDYWLSQDYWSFNEAALIFFLKDASPFPREIKNVFEIDEKHNKFARNLAQKLLDTKTRGIEGEWLYWLMKSQPNNTKTLERFCPTTTNNFVNQNTYLSKTVLLKIVSKHMSGVLNVSNIFKEKVKKLIERENIEKAHDSHIKNYLIKTIVSDDGFQNNISNVCAAELFLITLARLPELKSSRVILEQIASVKSYSSNNAPETEEEIYTRKIKLRLENLEEYKLLFKRDNQSQILDFLLQGSDKEILHLQGRLVDFIRWAMDHNILIPTELKSNNGVEKSAKSVDDVELWKKFIEDKLEGEFKADIDYANQAINAYNILTRTQKEKLSYFDVKKSRYKKTVITNELLDLAKQYKISIAKSSINTYITLPFVEKLSNDSN